MSTIINNYAHPKGTTRLAPSPTGALHLGNARTFLINWLLARQNGWRILLRIEDIDSPRVRADSAQQALDDLKWLGLDWDEGPIYQSQKLNHYQSAAKALLDGGWAYPCVCTRSEIETAASAPHASDGASVYPGTCRGRYATDSAARSQTGRSPALRFQLASTRFDFIDGFRGDVTIDTATLGDFPILKGDGTPAYQLACALDDAESGVTQVVRGDDLIDSVPRQVMLMRALGLGDRVPQYTHLPLVLGPDGRRLAKRHGDTRLSAYRIAGTTPQQILVLLAHWLGITHLPQTLDQASDLLPHFDLRNVSRNTIRFTTEDHQQLTRRL